jgi:capsular exopolysaccharide synthesis family protein
VTQTTQTPVDPFHSESENGDARSNQRGLMVREYEMNGLSPYLAQNGALPYVDGAPAGMSFAQLAHAFRRRWLLSLIAGLLVGVPVAALVWLVTPENYEVVAWLRVGDPPGTVIRNPTEYDQYRKTQAARIKSPTVLQGAFRKEGIADLPMLRSQREPLQFLQDELTVVSPLDSEVLLIKMRGKDAKQLVKIVNAVQEAYIDNVVDAEHGGLLKQQEVLQTTQQEKGTEMYNKRKALAELKNQFKASDLEQIKFRLNQLQTQSSSLMQSMKETRGELVKVEQRIAVLSSDKGSEPDQHLVELQIARDDNIAELTKQLTYLQQFRSETLAVSKLKERDPAIKRYDSSIAGAQEQIQKRRETILPQIIAFLKANSGERGEETGTVDQLELKRTRLSQELENQQENLNEVTTEVAKLGKSSVDIEDLEAQLKALETQRAKLAEQLDSIGLDLNQPARVTLLEKATEPEGTNPVFRYVLTIFAGIAGLAIGTGAVVAMEYQARRLSTSGELSTNTGLRVLGVVPNLDSLSRAKGANGSAALQGILAESVDSIRTILLQQSRENAPRVIMVTSAGDREGKTTVASHLAASLARAGRRTLLVDGDLRSPTVHAMFGAAQEPGLCEMLRGEIDLEGAIQPTQVDGLMLIAAGICDYQSIAALSKNSLHEIFEKAREQFEFVVIDAAPVLNYADTLLMGARVDAAVISTRRDVSQLHKVYEARERMESVGIRVLGAVVNGITETSRRPAFATPS